MRIQRLRENCPAFDLKAEEPPMLALVRSFITLRQLSPPLDLPVPRHDLEPVFILFEHVALFSYNQPPIIVLQNCAKPHRSTPCLHFLHLPHCTITT
jgi:hypothetical protein